MFVCKVHFTMFVQVHSVYGRFVVLSNADATPHMYDPPRDNSQISQEINK